MTRLSRRHFLATSAAVAATGIEGIVAARRAPAYAQGTRLHLLQWSHFVPAADTLFEAQAKEFGKQAGVEVAIERINQNDMQTRATAAIQSGAGPDIIILANNHAHLYEASLVDVSDVAEEIGAQAGRLVRLRQGELRCGRPMDRRAAVHHLVGDHLSRGLAEGSGLRVSEDLGRLPQGRPRHEGQGQAVRPGLRSQHQRSQQLVLSDGVDVGRHGGRSATAARWCSTARTRWRR